MPDLYVQRGLCQMSPDRTTPPKERDSNGSEEFGCPEARSGVDMWKVPWWDTQKGGNTEEHDKV